MEMEAVEEVIKQIKVGTAPLIDFEYPFKQPFPSLCPVKIYIYENEDVDYEKVWDGDFYGSSLLRDYVLFKSLKDYPMKSKKITLDVAGQDLDVYFEWIDADIPTFIWIVPDGYMETQDYIFRHRTSEVWDFNMAVVRPIDHVYWALSLYAAIPMFYFQWKKARLISIEKSIHIKEVSLEEMTYGGMTQYWRGEHGKLELVKHRIPYISWYDAALLEALLQDTSKFKTAMAGIYRSPLYPYRYLECRRCPYFPEYCRGIVPSKRVCLDKVDVEHFEVYRRYIYGKYRAEEMGGIKYANIEKGECGADILGDMRHTFVRITRERLGVDTFLETETGQYILDSKGHRIKKNFRSVPELFRNSGLPVIELGRKALDIKKPAEKKEKALEEYGRMLRLAIRTYVRPFRRVIA